MTGRQIACTCAGLIIIGTGHASPAQGQTRPPSPSPPPAPAPAPPPAAAQTPQPSDEIVVVANPTERSSIDRTTYVVRDTAEARSSNVLEVLDRVPSLEVTANGQLRLLGRSGVRVQIDGQDVANPQAVLRSLQGSQVARIEVISNPSAQFSAQGTGGIVNIILRRSFSAGIGGSATGSAGSYGAYNARLSPTWSRGRFSASGSVGLSRSVSPSSFELSRTLVDPNGVALSESSESGSRRSVARNVSGNLVATYRPTQRQSVTITANAVHSDGESSGRSLLLSSLDPGNPLTLTTAGTLDVYAQDMAVDYRRDGGRPGESMTFSAKRSTTHVLGDTAYSSASALTSPGIFDLRLDSIARITIAKLDYLLPFSGGRRLAFGGSIQHRRDDESSGTAGILPLTGNPFSSASAIGGSWTETAIYVTYQFPLLGGTALAGLRVEDRNYDVDGVTGPSAHGTNLFPSLHLERRLTSTLTANLSYSRRIDWPSIAQLAPSLRFSNSTTASAGNPLLRPDITDSFELKLSAQLARQNLSLTAFARRTPDNRSGLFEVDSNGVLVIQQINFGTEVSRGVNLNIRGPLGAGFSYSVEGNLSDEHIDNPGAAVTFARNSVNYDASAILEYRDGTEGRRDADHIEIRARYSGPFQGAFFSGSSFVSTNATWSHAWTDRLSSVLTVSEFTGSLTYRWRSFSETTRSRQLDRQAGPRVTFSLSLSLGASGH